MPKLMPGVVISRLRFFEAENEIHSPEIKAKVTLTIETISRNIIVSNKMPSTKRRIRNGYPNSTAHTVYIYIYIKSERRVRDITIEAEREC